MWNRRELKRESKHNLKRNYWTIMAVCFVMALLAIEYGSATQLAEEYNSDKEYAGEVAHTVEHGDKRGVLAALINRGDKGWSQELHPQKGVFASVFHAAVRTRQIFMNAMRTAEHIIQGHGWAVALVGMLSVLLSALYEILAKNLLLIGERRFFLENHLYHKTPIGRIFSTFRRETFLRIAWIMLARNIFLFLWSLTIVGGIIKRYSYKMIPYILAENPQIGRKEAFALSMKMMKGNKWRAFLLDVSFIPWNALASLTMGLLGIFFVNPYVRGAEAELYLKLREHAVEQRQEGWQFFTDEALVSLPAGSEGIYYPGLEKKKGRALKIDYHRHYSVINLVLFFFTASFIGWCWEVFLHLVRDGVFVDRGTMLGPWLPIYGIGGVVALVVLKRFIDRPHLTFGLTMVICGIVEYFTSWYLEMSKGIKWWDYSGYLLNLNGRICLEGLLTFAIAGCAFIYIIAPRLDILYNRIPNRTKLSLCAVLIACFGADMAYSHFHPNTGKGITDYQ